MSSSLCFNIIQYYWSFVKKPKPTRATVTLLVEHTAFFLEADTVDKASFFYAPILIGGRDAVAGIGGSGVERVANAVRLKRVKIRRLGEDIYLTGYPADTLN